MLPQNEQEKVAYKFGVEQGLKHANPSGKTLKALESMQKQIDYIVSAVDSLKEINTKEHSEIIDHQKSTNGKVMLNTEFRLRNEVLVKDFKNTCEDVTKFKGGLMFIKWLLGFIGFSNIIIIIYLLSTHT